jgi:serine/threonine-protein kinase
MSATDDREQHDVAWLQTLVAENGDTIEQHRDSTIVPAPVGPDTAGRRSLEVLRRLAERQGDSSHSARNLGDTIGEGGMGVVHVGEQVALGRQVAVKKLRPDKYSETATMDLLREAWVTGSLEHPNVVPVYEIRFDADARPSSS